MRPGDPRHYNYDSFIAENFKPHNRFDKSPELGRPSPDFPLWQMDGRRETSMKEAWQGCAFLVVEFGSLT